MFFYDYSENLTVKNPVFQTVNTWADAEDDEDSDG